MGLPAELVDALDSLSAEGPTEPPEPSPEEEQERPMLDFAQGRLARATKRLTQHLDALEEKNLSSVSAAANLIEKARLSTAGDDFDFDGAVESLQRWEEHLKGIYLPDLRQAEKNRRQVSSLPPQFRAGAKAMADRQIRVYTDILRNVRDTRWQLMAIRAEREDPGDAPVFSDPKALLQYLDDK
jgi:hypothetical protein